MIKNSQTEVGILGQYDQGGIRTKRLFEQSDQLSDDQVQSALKYVIKDGVASQDMGILTGGVFLMAFAIKLGASNRDSTFDRHETNIGQLQARTK